ncbi:hypothetical protein COOONC_07203 [Cooperia oncophora]
MDNVCGVRAPYTRTSPTKGILGSATGSEDEIEDQFDREERERKKRFEGFGLVGAKKKDDESGPTENPYELSRKPALPVYQVILLFTA